MCTVIRQVINFVSGPCIYIFGGINSHEWGVLSKNTLLMTDRSITLSPSNMPEPLAGHVTVTILPHTSIHKTSSSNWSSAIFNRLM